MTIVEYIAIALVCLVASNIRTWRLGMKKGIEKTLENLKRDGVFDYLDDSTETI